MVHDAIVSAKAETDTRYPGKLDFVVFYLDDGVVAGDAPAVSHFKNLFQQRVSDLGLCAADSECEVIPSAGSSWSFPDALFAGCAWKVDEGFKLLVSPFGTNDFMLGHTSSRVAKTDAVISKIVEYEDTQGSLLMLRHSASWGKVIYSACTVPPSAHADALASFGASVRVALGTLCGDPLSDRSWYLAQLGIAHGGIGIRDPSLHAPAAYLSSLSQTASLCSRIDRGFDPDDAGGGLSKREAEDWLQQRVLDAASWQREDRPPTQRELSGLIDAAARKRLLDSEFSDATFGAHVELCAIPGAGMWLTAPPANDGRHLDNPLFKLSLRRRLRAPVCSQTGFCPCCGQVFDCWGDHVLVCQCGGDRTIKHNAVRDEVFRAAVVANQSPEREKAGLLPDRPADDGLPMKSGRRPADVWLPKGRKNRAEALDFAVTSGMRADLFRACRENPGEVFERYEKIKREYKSTAAACESANFSFVPVIFEAHAGGWSSTARALMDHLAREASAWQREPLSVISLQTAQRISIALQRETARAVLKRLPSVGPVAEHANAWDSPGDTWQ
jgi:hypothetical protein